VINHMKTFQLAGVRWEQSDLVTKILCPQERREAENGELGVVHTPIVPPLRRLSQEDPKSWASLGYRARACLKKTKTKRERERE
jgi:hypothetical protein